MHLPGRHTDTHDTHDTHGRRTFLHPNSGGSADRCIEIHWLHYNSRVGGAGQQQEVRRNATQPRGPRSRCTRAASRSVISIGVPASHRVSAAPRRICPAVVTTRTTRAVPAVAYCLPARSVHCPTTRAACRRRRRVSRAGHAHARACPQ